MFFVSRCLFLSCSIRGLENFYSDRTNMCMWNYIRIMGEGWALTKTSYAFNVYGADRCQMMFLLHSFVRSYFVLVDVIQRISGTLGGLYFIST